MTRLISVPTDNNSVQPARTDTGSTRRQILGGSALGLLALGAHALGCASAKADTPTPQPTTPQEALQALKDGNLRFSTRQPLERNLDEIERIWTEAAAGQNPFASILACADSRTAPELVFDQLAKGLLFVVREAGNIAKSPTSLGSLEFAHAALGSMLVVVVGHSACGAINAAFTNATPGGNIDAIVNAIKPGISGAASLPAAIEANVRATMNDIRTNSPLLTAAETDKKIMIVGAVQDIPTGVVTFLS